MLIPLLLFALAPAHPPLDPGLPIVQSGPLPGNGTGQLLDFPLQQFDDQGGARVLESVTLELFSSVSGGGTSTTSGIPTTIKARLSGDLLLAGQPLVETEALIDTTIANIAVLSFSVFGTDADSALLTTPAELAPWIGRGTITLTSFTEIQTLEEPPNTVFFGAGGGSNYTVTYTWREAPEVYCTAGTSFSGCSAALAASGIPSASSGAGFDLSATGVEGQKDGLFFYGTGGRQANPWGNGSSFQCVVPPVIRAGLLTGAGTAGACDGAFAQDLAALWAAKPATNPGAGALVQAQLWYRDPANTSNQSTSLSDAIEFCVAP